MFREHLKLARESGSQGAMYSANDLKELLPVCNKQNFIEFKNGKITFKQFRARVLKSVAQKNGQSLNFTTLDDLKGVLCDEFFEKPTVDSALLGKYLD